MAGIVLFDSLEMTLHKVRHLGPRTHDAHVTPEDIEELRKFIQIQLAKKRPHARASRISRSRPTPLRLVCQQRLHGAEFEHAEDSPVQADAMLGEEDRSRTL